MIPSDQERFEQSPGKPRASGDDPVMLVDDLVKDL